MEARRTELTTARRGVRLSAVVWGLLIAVYVPVISGLIARLWNGAAYDIAVMAPLLAGYLTWQRRHALKTAAGPGSPWGLVVVGAGLLVYGLGVWFEVVTLTRASLLISLAGALYFQGGAPLLRLLALPLALLLLIVPPRAAFHGVVARGLQAFTAVTVGEVLSRFGLLVERQGILLVLPRVTLEVTEGCSGIRSLAALSTLALAVVASVPLTRRARWLFLLGTPVLAILVNLARVTAIGVVAALTPIPPELAHTVSNWIAFGAAVTVLVLLARRNALPERPVP